MKNMFNRMTTLMIIVPLAILAVGAIYAIATNYGAEDESNKYTSSEVIRKIQHDFPEFQPGDTWSTDFDDNGIWFITSASVDYWNPTLYRGSREVQGDLTVRIYYVWWFNENIGEIVGPWRVSPQELYDKRGTLPHYDRGGLPLWSE